MADLVKLKTGKIDKLASVDQDNKPVVPLEAGNVYFAVDTTTHKGKIVYDAPNGTSVDRIVMSTDAEKADSADKALTADKAVTLVAARNIDGINFNGGANVIHYTTCATNASKVEKIVTINGFALISGARISVRFANTNSADSPTLNVSGTGTKPILYNGTNIPTAYLTNNKVWDFIYDGDLDAWIFVGDKNIDTNTTYTEATATKSGLMSASDKTKLDTIQSGAKVVNYESHLASGVKVGTITIGGIATDIFSTPDTWTAFKGATADAAGSAGYIGNAPAAGEQNAFFTGAGTWKTLTVADDKNNGLMSSDDRTKLDSIESNANYTYLNAVAPISVNKHVGTVTISHDASGATAGTYGTNSSTVLTPGFGESISVTGFQVNATGHVTSASNHNVKMPDTLVDDTHRGLMSSDMYLAWNKGITLAGHQLLLGSAWSKTDFLDTLGLTNALRWVGNATVAIADGSKTDPKITGYDFSKAKPGDVVLDKDNKREYAWTLAGAWESLGPDGDLATADHRHANATSTTDGFMSADDKAKLDTVESKANYIYVSANAPISVDKHVGALTITHNTSGVTAGAYGDTVAQAPGFGASFLVPNLTVNATGHVTVAGAHTVTIPNALVTDKTNGLMSADDKARFDIIKDGYYVKRAGDTMTGDLYFSNVGTSVRQIRFQAGTNDYGRLAVGATDVNAGYVEIASADDGTEPIYVRQYTGGFTNIKRTLTLLDASGNTILPGTLTAAGATINGATTINSTLHTTGATTLDSTLSVGGTATMKGALNVNGAATIGSNLTVAGTSTLNGPLVTNGAVTFNNKAFNYAGMEMAGADVFRHVWFSDFVTKGKPVYNDNFVYNPHTAQLWIKSDADASSTTKTGALIIGADNGDQIAIDDNEILARSKSTAGTLYLQYEGGRIETQAIIHNGNGTDATSTTTGSIQTAGGVGIVKQLRVGGATTLGSSLTVASGTSIGGALSVSGNTTLNNNLTVNGNILGGPLAKIQSIADTHDRKLLYDDPTFKRGTNGVLRYNNEGSSDLVTELIAAPAGTPTTSGRVIRITVNGTTTSPGFGGFYQTIKSRPNVIFVIKYLINLPVGRRLNTNTNSMGNGYKDYFITSTEGTGNWKLYTRIVECGSTGTFSNGGYVSVTGGANPSTSAPLVWYLGGIWTYELTDSAVAMPLLYKNGHYGMALPNSSDADWIRTTQTGIIPYQSGGVTAGHQNLGSSGWYFGDGYVTNMHTNILNANDHVTAPTMYTSNWFRSTGQSGWCSETYGGGWYMTDSTWIRAFNGKSIYAGGAIIRTDGQFQVGDNGNKFKVDGNGNETLAGTLDASNYRMAGSSNPQNANNVATTGLWYYTSGGPSTSLGASTTDGALYTEAYSGSWQGQIAQDYRNGNLFVRGKNNGTWTGWKAIVSSDSYSMTFHWNGQNGQPTWLWGGNNSSDMYVYNPSNFHVKEADNLYYQYSNEINFKGGDRENVLFNYRGENGTTSGNTATKTYRFCNNNGGTSGVTLYADAFAGTAENAKYLTTYSVDGSDDLDCLQKAFNVVPKSVATAVRLQHGSHAMALGWFLTNYNYDHAYGGWFISDYETPTWIGVNDGQWNTQSFITSRNISSQSVNYANSAGSVSWNNIKEKTNATSSANGLMSASDKSKLDGIASGATKNVSTVKSFTLSANSWVNGGGHYFYDLADSLITATSNQEIIPANVITPEQLKALQKANLNCDNQIEGHAYLRVFGEKPTIDIPITVIFRGTI